MSGWTLTAGADVHHRDQEIDLRDGWWAVIGDEGDHWSWQLWDHWLTDEGEPVVEGRCDDEASAKAAALTEFVVLKVHAPTPPATKTKHFEIIIEGDCPDDVPDEWLSAVAASAEVQVAEPEVYVKREPHNPTSFDVSNIESTVVIT